MRFLFGSLGVFSFLGLIILACSIPFQFESPSIYYKLGMDKMLLRGGKVIGVAAMGMVSLQLVTASRFKCLDRIYSLNSLLLFHRRNGILIGLLCLIHPLFILAAEDFVLFPIEIRYWPEFLGMGVLFFLLLFAAGALWRKALGIDYHRWLTLHRIGVIIIVISMVVHIGFVSETFMSGIPKTMLLLTAGTLFLLLTRLWCRRFFTGKRTFKVSRIMALGSDATLVEARRDTPDRFDYIPGQFAFITPVSQQLPHEEHPFTLSSTPSRPGTLQFVIRSLGDWTGRIHQLKVGESMVIDGPYGLFGHLFRLNTRDDPIIMVAGGIGITPMLSMLRFMADTDDRRRVLLIWSNRDQGFPMLLDELNRLAGEWETLTLVHHLTGSGSGEGGGKRLNLETLDDLTRSYDRRSRLFICGPPAMMKTVKASFLQLGFLSSRVYKEQFQL